MEEVNQYKIKRSIVRRKITIFLKPIDKLLAEELGEHDSHEIKTKMIALNEMAKEHHTAFCALITAMTTAGVSEEEMEKEIDYNAELEAGYEDYVDRMSKTLRLEALLGNHTRVMASTNTWLENTAVVTPDSIAKGEAIVKELDQLVTQLQPMSKKTIFKPLYEQCQDSLRKVRTHLLKSGTAAKPDTDAAVTVKSATPHATSVLHLKPPTFSGKVQDFKSFQERFQDLLKARTDIHSDADKCCLLRDAMLDPHLRTQVEKYGRGPDGFKAAMEALRIRYGRASVAFPVYLKEMIQPEKFSYTQDSMLHLLDKTEHLLAAMEGIGGGTLSQVLVGLAVMNFDDELGKEWTRYLAGKEDIPKVEDLVKFAKPLSHTLPFQQQATVTKQQPPRKDTPRRQQPSGDSGSTTRLADCPLCKNPYHSLARCSVFLGYTPQQRQGHIQRTKSCLNCLHHSHVVSQCASTHSCRHCKGRHHTLLHKDDTSTAATTPTLIAPATENKEGAAAEDTAHCSATDEQLPLKRGFILTALVALCSGDRKIVVRAGLDTCSGTSIVSERVASLLHLKRRSTRLNMSGIVSTTTVKQYSSLQVRTVIPSEFEAELTVAIAAQLPESTPPPNRTAVLNSSIIKGERLADQYLGGKLDLLVSAADLGTFLLPEQVRICPHTGLTAMNTQFGWALFGDLKDKSEVTVLKVELKPDETYVACTKLWELERVPKADKRTPEEKSAIKQFQENLSCKSDGRYSVKLPRVEEPPILGESRRMALSRFYSNERKLRKHDQLNAFQSEMNTYFALDHAEVVPKNEINKPHYYMPVHGIVKEGSTTTKMRPVFDASATTTSGSSFNDQLLPGPSLYPFVSDLLLQFRLHPIAMSADIAKMFRQIHLSDEEKDFHRFLVRDSKGNVLDCRMKRLTFGVKSSPFVATSVLQYHAEQHSHTLPEASNCLSKHFYVDDLVISLKTVEEAVHLRKTTCELLKTAGMELRKWRSNSEQFKATIPIELVETADLSFPGAPNSQKALGLHWQVSSDTLHVSTPSVPEPAPTTTTMRTVASVAAQVFDVLGFFSPFVIQAKILMQQLWICKTDWDDVLPARIFELWTNWTSQLPLITSHPVARKYSNVNSPVVNATLQGFSDASKAAYGAAVFLRREHRDGTISTALVYSKARVCPLKTRSIGQLELQAAYLLSDLLLYVANTLGLPLQSTRAWTDSMIVLHWLRTMPCRLKDFEANRVAHIQEVLPDCPWRHVQSHHNPADAASRGVPAQELLNSKLWWHGPPWLSQPEQEWPLSEVEALPRSLPGMRAVILAVDVKPVAPFNLWTRYSCYHKLKRTTAWIKRFIHNLRHKNLLEKITTVPLTCQELFDTHHFLLWKSQQESFPEVFALIAKGKPLPPSHRLGGMIVHQDEQGLLKATGRLRHHSLTTPKVIIPLSLTSAITKLLVSTSHKDFSHPGLAALLSLLAHRYYIPGLKNELKAVARRCITCRREYGKPMHQKMGLLPLQRTTEAPMFQSTGIDFAGPFLIKFDRARKAPKMKAYVCLFICLATRFIHLEVCEGLDTDNFMATLRRFTNRRGLPTTIYTDNGSNFIGAHAELLQIQALLRSSQNTISHYCSSHNVAWKFIPPRTPHFGGIWEAGVRAMKVQMRKLLADRCLRLLEFETLLTDIEAILNSRPLAAMDSTDPEADLAITPAHFMLGRPLRALPSREPSTANISHLRSWMLVSRLRQDVYAAWKACIITSLMERKKWRKDSPNLSIGEVVLLKDETLEQGRLPLALVTATYPGPDGIVRAVDIRVRGKTYRRDVRRVIQLFLQDNQEDKEQRTTAAKDYKPQGNCSSSQAPQDVQVAPGQQ